MTGKDDASHADTLPAESRLGQLIAEKYRIERLLGRGGMGEVYEARHVVVGRRFAIKFLHAHLARGADAVSRFLREAQAAGALDSEHIAAVLDFDTAADGAPFLVMEYLTGESLASVLRREGPLPVPRALAILLQVCRGLDIAHRAGIVHRDLKPDNLFVTQQPGGSERIKILDFGIAKLVAGGADGGVTQSGAILGTPFYMAPEQARGEKSVDFRVDVHAFGVVAYELLSGKKPHPGESYNAILAHILTQPVTPLSALRPGLPNGLISVIERAMAFDPAQRQSSIAQLGNELLPFAGREVLAVEAHFDLRPAPRAEAGAVTEAGGATEAAVDVPPSAHEGTLQSAIGDVPSASSSRERPRATPWLVLALGLIGAVFVLLKAQSRAPSSTEDATGVHSATAALGGALASVASVSPPAEVSRESPLASTPASSAAALTPPALAVPTPPAPESAAKTARPRKRGTAPTAAPPGAHAPEVSFDEKNPY